MCQTVILYHCTSFAIVVLLSVGHLLCSTCQASPPFQHPGACCDQFSSCTLHCRSRRASNAMLLTLSLSSLAEPHSNPMARGHWGSYPPPCTSYRTRYTTLIPGLEFTRLASVVHPMAFVMGVATALIEWGGSISCKIWMLLLCLHQ